MAGGDFQVRSKILAAIDETDDKGQRNVLLLMFGVLESNENGICRIEKKIDALLSDEESLRKSVLNGHEANHHRHHDWVEARMKSGCESSCAKLEGGDLSAERKWVQSKMEAEAQDEKDAKEIAKAGKKAAVEQFARMAVVALVSALSGVTAALTMLK